MVFFCHTWGITGRVFKADALWGKIIFFMKAPAWGGVWIFFILSGYLCGKGFASDKYSLTPSGILKFYLYKLIKIGIPTWFFIFIFCVIAHPDFIVSNPSVLTRFLTFTYDGIPETGGIGVCWFVSTLMQMYLLAPFFCYFLHTFDAKTNHNKIVRIIVLILFITIGFLYRIKLYTNGFDWELHVYRPFLPNLDLFLVGIQLNKLVHPDQGKYKSNTFRNSILLFSLAMLWILNSYLCFYSNQKHYLFIYQYIFPSIYAAFVSVFIYFYIEKRDSAVRKGYSVSRWFDKISFQFYLWHSLILINISPYITASSAIEFYFKLLAITFVITCILAALYSQMFYFLIKRPLLCSGNVL